MPELSQISDTDLAAFFSERCVSVDDTQIKKLKTITHDFLCTLPWCPDAEIDQEKLNRAQAYLIFAMNSGSFDPLASRADPILRRRAIGRNAIEREWFEPSEDINGVNPIHLLRTQSIPYGLLINWLCPELHEASTEANEIHCPAVCVV